MSDNTKQQLEDQVRHIANTIEQGTWEGFEPTEDEPFPSAFDYLQDALDIQYIVTGKREYIAARVLVAFGGPNIWINTQTKTVEGYWWGTEASARYHTDALGLDEALETLWEC